MVARTGPDIRGAVIVGACLAYLTQGVAFNSRTSCRQWRYLHGGSNMVPRRSMFFLSAEAARKFTYYKPGEPCQTC